MIDDNESIAELPEIVDAASDSNQSIPRLEDTEIIMSDLRDPIRTDENDDLPAFAVDGENLPANSDEISDDVQTGRPMP